MCEAFGRPFQPDADDLGEAFREFHRVFRCGEQGQPGGAQGGEVGRGVAVMVGEGAEAGEGDAGGAQGFGEFFGPREAGEGEEGAARG